MQSKSPTDQRRSCWIIATVILFVMPVVTLCSDTRADPPAPVPPEGAAVFELVRHEKSWRVVLPDGRPAWVYLIDQYRRADACGSADINGDGYVNMLDFAILSKHYGKECGEDSP